MRTIQAPIINASTSGTAEQCSRYMLARQHGDYNAHAIQNIIVPAYFSHCASVDLDPVMLIAQLIHETGCLTSWWAARPRRNPAGIGVTGVTKITGVIGKPPVSPGKDWAYWKAGVWRAGVSFPTWADDAIPAHVGRVLAYALRDEQANDVQGAVIRRALIYRPLPAKYRGCAPTWQDLNGRWAVPGTTYAQKLVEIANAIAPAR